MTDPDSNLETPEDLPGPDAGNELQEPTAGGGRDEDEILEGEVLEEVRAVVQEVAAEYFSVVASYHEGPLPHHESYAAYERTLPGSADRILAMTEKEQDNRHHLQRVGLYASVGIRVFGMVLAFAISLVGLLYGGSLVADGKSVAGLAFLLGSLGPIAAAFLFRRHLPPPPARQPTETTEPDSA